GRRWRIRVAASGDRCTCGRADAAPAGGSWGAGADDTAVALELLHRCLGERSEVAGGIAGGEDALRYEEGLERGHGTPCRAEREGAGEGGAGGGRGEEGQRDDCAGDKESPTQTHGDILTSFGNSVSVTGEQLAEAQEHRAKCGERRGELGAWRCLGEDG